MMLSKRLFAAALELLPREFRERYRSELVLVFEDRLSNLPAGRGMLFALSEAADIAGCAIRSRLPRRSTHHRIVLSLAAATTLALLFTFPSAAETRLDVSAHDPAGKFTITIIGHRAVGATIDGVPLPPHRLTHSGDSIRILARNGKVALALAYDPQSRELRWNPRPPSCSMESGECAIR